MDLLLLGGLSPHNQPWIKQVGEYLAPLAKQCVVHHYTHWQSGGQINIEHELEGATQKAKTLGDYAIFAKSIGTVVSAMGIASYKLRPKVCIFVGVPLGLILKNGYDFTGWLKAGDCSVVFAQNTSDPAGSYSELKAYLESSNLTNYTLLELPGDTHDYSNLDKLKEIVGEALERK